MINSQDLEKSVLGNLIVVPNTSCENFVTATGVSAVRRTEQERDQELELH